LNRAPAAPAVQVLRLLAQGAMSRLRRLWLATAGGAYGAYAWSVLALFALAAGLGVLVLPTRQAAWRWSRFAARSVIRALCIPFSITWADARLPPTHIVVANHCSYADSLFLIAALATPHLFVAKAELENVFLLSRLLRKLGTVFIERFEPVQSVAEVDRLQQELRRGHSLILFPEGTFTRAPGLRPFHLGAFQVAAAAGVPVITCTLRGTRSLLRDGQRMIHRVPVSATIGAPLPPQPGGDSFAEAVRLRDLVRDEMLRHCGEPDLRLLA
jgi:1-acyl-sn-glycerol-3-phosphate acyltransferase